MLGDKTSSAMNTPAPSPEELLARLADMIERNQCGDFWDVNGVSEEDHARLPSLLRTAAHRCDGGEVVGVDADLVLRCRELLEWSATGLLVGGNGGAIRALAERLKESVGEHYALSVAESQTKDDAMRAILSLTPDSRMRGLEGALEPFVKAAKVIEARPQDYENRVAMIGGLVDACDLTKRHFADLLSALSKAAGEEKR